MHFDLIDYILPIGQLKSLALTNKATSQLWIH